MLNLIAHKWAVLEIYALSEGTRRHGQLQREIEGVSQKMLTKTPRTLERDGLVRRETYPVVPPRVEYSLTPLRGTLVDTLSALCRWAEEHIDKVEAARRGYDARAETAKTDGSESWEPATREETRDMQPHPAFLSEVELPPLPLEEWEDTRETLHRYSQVVGKLRMELSPPRNHWWHVTLYVTPQGLTSGPIPHAAGTFKISFDLLENRLAVVTSGGGGFEFELNSLPVAGFYERLFSGLGSLGIGARINPEPFDLDDEHPLDENSYHDTCDQGYVRRYHTVLVWVDQVLKQFSERLNGKQSPVQLFWHSFDLALNRFSDRRASLPEETDPVTREAYSHEVISFGFWPGDREFREPAFYSYTASPRAPGPHRQSAGRGRSLVASGRYDSANLRDRATERFPGRDAARVLTERLPRRCTDGGLGCRRSRILAGVAEENAERL